MWTIIILVLFVLVAVGALTFAIRMKPAKRPQPGTPPQAPEGE